MIALSVMVVLLVGAIVTGAIYSRRHQADADEARRQLPAAEQTELMSGIAASAIGGNAAGGLLVARAMANLSERRQQHERRTAAR